MRIALYWSSLLFLILLNINIVFGSEKYGKCKANATKETVSYKHDQYTCPTLLTNDFKTITKISTNKLVFTCFDINALNEELFPYVEVGTIPEVKISNCPLRYDNIQKFLEYFHVKHVNMLIFDNIDFGNATLDRDYFQGLEDLQSLRIDQSKVLHSKDNMLEKMTNLKNLTLNETPIELSSDFLKMVHLKIIEFFNHNYSKIPDNFFANQTELIQIVMWSNKLKSINEKLFEDVINLNLLELGYNEIETIHPKAFINLGNLKILSLRNNQLQNLPIGLFDHTANLTNIILDGNRNLELTENIFKNLLMLEQFTANDCNLKVLPEQLFNSSRKLRTIKLNNNDISELKPNLLANLKKLKELDLSYNKLSSIPKELFSDLDSLEILNLSHNNLKEIGRKVMDNLKNLINLDMSYNRIIDLYYELPGNKYDVLLPLNRCLNLKTLDFNHNQITLLPAEFLFIKQNLETLNLAYNNLTFIRLSTLQATQNIYVDLSHNQITQVDFDLENDQTSYPTLNLRENPINCDCKNFKFVQHLQLNTKELSIQFDPKPICKSPKKLKNKSLVDVPLLALTCPIRDNCSNDCECHWRPADESAVIDCAAKNLTQYPMVQWPRDDYPPKLVEIHLEDNQLTDGVPNDTWIYQNITSLYLSRNRIQNLSWLPTKLEVLKLDNNFLKKLSKQVLRTINTTYIASVTLDGNPWECDCEAVGLSDYLRRYGRNLGLNPISCSNGKLMINLNHNDLCESYVKIYLITGILGAMALCCFLFLYAIYWRFHREIKVWCYAHNLFLGWVTEEELDKDKIYDAFISFSHKDETFVVDQLVSVLEAAPHPYKLCLHYRDWTPGEFITTQIHESVKKSHRTIVVLSPNFIESVWGKMEFRTAHTEAMCDGRPRIVVVLYGDVDIEVLDDELKSYLKTKTYVKWGDPWFWKKLRYALPHSHKRFQKNEQKHANVLGAIEDRFVLKSISNGGGVGKQPPLSEVKINGEAGTKPLMVENV